MIRARTLNGIGMCLFQAVAAFEHFTGMAADVDAMHSDSLELLAAEL